MDRYKILEENDNLRFKIPLSCFQLSEESVLNSIKDKLLSFIGEYVELSRKYSVAEILGEDFCLYAGYSYKQECIKALKADFEKGRVSVFGDILGTYSNIPLNNFIGTKLFYYNTARQEFVFEYIYDVYGFKNLNQYLGSRNWGQPAIKISSFSYSENSEYLDGEEEPIYFDMGVSSNLFYQYIESDNKPLDNTIFAYRNTLRYNSFVKCLSDLWVNKYNWDLEWLGSKNQDYINANMKIVESSRGIFLDGEIRYYEDFLSNKLELPDLSNYPA